MNIVLNIVFVILVPLFLGVLLGFADASECLVIIILISYVPLLDVGLRYIDKKH